MTYYVEYIEPRNINKLNLDTTTNLADYNFLSNGHQLKRNILNVSNFSIEYTLACKILIACTKEETECVWNI